MHGEEIDKRLVELMVCVLMMGEGHKQFYTQRAALLLVSRELAVLQYVSGKSGRTQQLVMITSGNLIKLNNVAFV